MIKSSAIVGVITFILVLIAGLLYNICCLVSPVLAAVLGLAAGFLCSMFEKPVNAEKAAVRAESPAPSPAPSRWLRRRSARPSPNTSPIRA